MHFGHHEIEPTILVLLLLILGLDHRFLF